MVDANGAFTAAQAREWACRYAGFGVRYFEEPVSSDDVGAMRLVREKAPPGLAVAAGEYAWSARDVRRLLGAVDIAQADATRCGGLTELVAIDALCAAHGTPLSLHCAPAISAHCACALGQLLHLEYFHDHVRLEAMLFDGVPTPAGGTITPDASVPGHGLTLRRDDAEEFRV
jgi:L-alanine-DL-glutamate epimerase-like enolase superfamily enzyme